MLKEASNTNKILVKGLRCVELDWALEVEWIERKKKKKDTTNSQFLFDLFIDCLLFSM